MEYINRSCIPCYNLDEWNVKKNLDKEQRKSELKQENAPIIHQTQLAASSGVPACFYDVPCMKAGGNWIYQNILP